MLPPTPRPATSGAHERSRGGATPRPSDLGDCGDRGRDHPGRAARQHLHHRMGDVRGCLVLAAAGFFYARVRPDPRLASGCLSTAQVIAFAAVAAPLSYLAATANLPLNDRAYDAIDRALGLDWKAMLDVMNAWPLLFGALRPIYLSLTLQMTTAVPCLAFTGRFSGLRGCTLAFILAALVAIATSAVLPAAGAWPFYGLTAADSPHVLPTVSTSWPVFYGLRGGSVRALVAP